MKTILVLTDFSKKAEHAAEFAFAIAEKTNAEIILYHSFPIPQVTSVIPPETRRGFSCYVFVDHLNG